MLIEKATPHQKHKETSHVCMTLPTETKNLLSFCYYLNYKMQQEAQHLNMQSELLPCV